MARRNYQYEKRQKELAKKKKKEEKRLRKLERKEAEATSVEDQIVEGEPEEFQGTGAGELPEDTED